MPVIKLCIHFDSHDNRHLLDHAVAAAKARGAEAVLHCGDVVAPTTLRVLQKHGLPVHVVHGNNTGDLFSLGKLSCEPASVVQYHGPDAALEFDVDVSSCYKASCAARVKSPSRTSCMPWQIMPIAWGWRQKISQHDISPRCSGTTSSRPAA